MMQGHLETSAMRFVVWLFAACLALAPLARAADSVDLTLVLVTDVSRSVDDAEFKLEKEGYTASITSRLPEPGSRIRNVSPASSLRGKRDFRARRCAVGAMITWG